MKKLYVVLMSILLVGCNTSEKEVVTVVALKGPTAMGMVNFMDRVAKDEQFDNKYEFSIVTSPDEATAMLVKGEADIAALPANLGATLYNNGGEIKATAINTLGVLYILENGNTINDIQDLKGKTIISAGKGATPEMSLRYILAENGIDPDKDITIEWKSEQAEVLAYLVANEGTIAMMPEPFVTTALQEDANITRSLDLTREWDKLQTDNSEKSALVTGILVARDDFIEDNSQALNEFLVNYEESVNFVNADTAASAQLVSDYNIVPFETAIDAIPNCNITFIEGNALENNLSGYLEVLFNQNPNSIGGVLPDEAFYYR
ncbi:sulfonate/nitrate/taurine transporter substrate-binding protein [Candidatus Epulonipiscium fishelsonii]|uniref:Sulfonate/nitrate/taurine transporter substrate-binding protein n=1 Tax=Candidatus Epulonipiscium fishelsonii TaxID=77094 RepID=A0ACC8X8H5_9FIRM|nr:sulfonate/nitrate/taurine transporter substrate-binding protein [Epulopiscium sp. SCG-B11WGA-EpuloA1]ONI43676.1 sulfonate/nitrate/taurine transporter substrate-binding protein [Epulopiscium sp. SCG-B05WGA-EpuloA1]